MTDICTKTLQSLAVFHSHLSLKFLRAQCKGGGIYFLVHSFWDFKLWLCDPMSRGNMSQPQKQKVERGRRKRSSLETCQVTDFNLGSISLATSKTAPPARNQMSTLEPVGPIHSQAIIFCPRAPKAHDHPII